MLDPQLIVRSNVSLRGSFLSHYDVIWDRQGFSRRFLWCCARPLSRILWGLFKRNHRNMQHMNCIWLLYNYCLCHLWCIEKKNLIVNHLIAQLTILGSQLIYFLLTVWNSYIKLVNGWNIWPNWLKAGWNIKNYLSLRELTLINNKNLKCECKGSKRVGSGQGRIYTVL